MEDAESKTSQAWWPVGSTVGLGESSSCLRPGGAYGGVEGVAEVVESGVVRLLFVFDDVGEMTVGFRGVQDKEAEEAEVEAEVEEAALEGVELWTGFGALSPHTLFF